MKKFTYTIKAKKYNELTKAERSMLTVLGFCSGIRGFEQGAERAGFRNVYSSDLEYHPGIAFYNNHEGVYHTGADIRRLTFDDVKSYVKGITGEIIRQREIDCILSGSPCKYVSRMNTRRRDFALSNLLMLEQIRLVEEFLPKTALFEQVDAFFDPAMEDLKNEFMASLQPLLGLCNVDHQIMNAMDYGARQNRKRVIFMLVRKDVGVPSFPSPMPPDMSKVSVKALFPYLDYTSSQQFQDLMVPTDDRVYSTMTAGGSGYFYEGGKDRRTPTIEERLVLSCLEGYNLDNLTEGQKKMLLGNMVQIPFSEALIRHVKVNILKR